MTILPPIEVQTQADPLVQAQLLALTWQWAETYIVPLIVPYPLNLYQVTIKHAVDIEPGPKEVWTREKEQEAGRASEA